MKPYAEKFYKSTAWKNTRASYLKSVGGLCELCLDKGIIRKADIIHHKEPITPENIDDADITLNWNNLQAVCNEHHHDIHNRHAKRYKVDEFGRVTMRD